MNSQESLEKDFELPEEVLDFMTGYCGPQHSDEFWGKLLERIGGYEQTARREALDGQPAAWKKGQKLVGPAGHVYELLEPQSNNDWTYRLWEGTKWGLPQQVIHFSPDEYVPWPRVGDRVRCMG